MSTRYLFYVSYIGSKFVGAQFQTTHLAVQNVFNVRTYGYFFTLNLL